MVNDTTTPPERAWLRPEACSGNTCDWRSGDWKRESFGDAPAYVLEDLTGWRSMDSAPKDGTRILVSCVYEVDGETHSHEWVDWWYSGEGVEGWLEFPKEIPAPFPPTHWQPITPPEARP